MDDLDLLLDAIGHALAERDTGERSEFAAGYAVGLRDAAEVIDGFRPRFEALLSLTPQESLKGS